MSQTLTAFGLGAGLLCVGLISATLSPPSAAASCEVLSRGLARPAVRDNMQDALMPLELDLAYVFAESPFEGVPAQFLEICTKPKLVQKPLVKRRSLASLPKVSENLRAALLSQRELLLQQPKRQRYKIGDRTLSPADFIAVIDQLLRGSGAPGLYPEVLPVARRGEVHFTAYCTPELQASRTRTDRFRFPLLRAPSKADRQYLPTRREVESSPDITQRFTALAWLEHPLDVHTMQLQGSGIVVFQDGTRQYLAYGCGNGRPYKSLLTAIREAHAETAAMSAREIRTWIAEDLSARSNLTWMNPSYVFFRESDAAPQGSAGVPLTAMISVAADPAHYPPGAVLLAEVPRPGHRGVTETRVLLVQDQGSGIKGRDRIDLYTGVGAEALDIARVISQAGEVFVLAPALPRA